MAAKVAEGQTTIKSTKKDLKKDKSAFARRVFNEQSEIRLKRRNDVAALKKGKDRVLHDCTRCENN